MTAAHEDTAPPAEAPPAEAPPAEAPPAEAPTAGDRLEEALKALDLDFENLTALFKISGFSGDVHVKLCRDELLETKSLEEAREYIRTAYERQRGRMNEKVRFVGFATV